MSNLTKTGEQTLQPAGEPLEAGLVQASLNTGVLNAPVPVASTAAVVVSSGNQAPLPAESSTDAFVSNGGEAFLLIGFALIGMVAIVRRQKI